MNFPFLITCCVICSIALTSSCNLLPQSKSQLDEEIQHSGLHVGDESYAADPRPWRGTHLLPHRHLTTVHGTLNIIGWGVLMPVGIMAARYIRMLSDNGYTLHVVSHFSGFLLGTLGWGFGISLKHNTAKEHAMTSHGIVGTTIFAFATLHLLAICWQPDDGERGWRRRCWVIYHNAGGYALMVLIIVNIFEGINKIESGSRRWEWCYGTVLGVLGVTALALELRRWHVI